MSSNKMGTVTDFHTDRFPNWKQADIALIGVEEYRGAVMVRQPTTDTLTRFREVFYRLYPHGKYRIADLGNLRVGEDLHTTYERLAEVCETLLSHQTIPLIIGGSHDLGYAQYQSYERLEKHIVLLNVDKQFDLGIDSQPNDSTHLRHIFAHKPNYLFDFAQLGHQRYLIEKRIMDTMQLLGYTLKSIGQMRDDFRDTEPVIRSGDMLSFDLSVIRRSDMPGVANGVFGLTAEEACQLCWYAGLSEQLSSAGFYGWDAEMEKHPAASELLATMVWYFIEGFANRKAEYSFKSHFYVKYNVPLTEYDLSLVFYKGQLTGKWWLELSANDAQKTDQLHRNLIIPCSYQDYLTALSGQLPERWIRAQDKY